MRSFSLSLFLADLVGRTGIQHNCLPRIGNRDGASALKRCYLIRRSTERLRLGDHAVNGSLIVVGLGSLSRFTCAGDVRNRDSRNDGDDGDDNEKFDQAERRVEL